METGEELFGSVYQRGEVIFRQGETGDKMYIIQSGAVKVSHQQGERETLIAIREKGDFFGEMALFEAEERSATATALRQTRLLPFTRASLLAKVQRDPSVALHFLKGLISRIQEADQEVKKLVDGDEILRAALGRSAPADLGVSSPAADAPPSSTPAEAQPAGVSIPELAEIWKVEAETRWFETGESIFLEGDPGEAMYIVLTGSVEITQGSGPDQRRLRQVNPGEFFGEWALITDQPRSTAATASSRSQLMPISRGEFSGRIQARPELALYLIQGLSARLRRVSAILSNPRASIHIVRQNWQPLIKKREPVKISIVSLGTCAGCSAVLLDEEILAQVLEVADILYCPMLIDQDKIPEADLVLIDGVVRLKEDQEKLEEARRKSRFVAAWGTCAAFGGVPADANRFELEELIEETFGQADDPFAYYLSGGRGVERTTYQENGVALLRKAGKLDDFVKVDYYVPGCPPAPAALLQLVGELTGRERGKAQPVVCGQCSRKPTKATPEVFTAFPEGHEDPAACFNSLGVFCLGFLINGGCEAACTRNGLPCWGCRGPAKIALKNMAEGDDFEEVVVQGLARRCKLEEGQARSLIKLLRKQGHGLFQFEPSSVRSLARLR
jgi:F420-non-reducing hydrogenase small subunit